MPLKVFPFLNVIVVFLCFMHSIANSDENDVYTPLLITPLPGSSLEPLMLSRYGNVPIPVVKSSTGGTGIDRYLPYFAYIRSDFEKAYNTYCAGQAGSFVPSDRIRITFEIGSGEATDSKLLNGSSRSLIIYEYKAIDLYYRDGEFQKDIKRVVVTPNFDRPIESIRLGKVALGGILNCSEIDNIVAGEAVLHAKAIIPVSLDRSSKLRIQGSQLQSYVSEFDFSQSAEEFGEFTAEVTSTTTGKTKAPFAGGLFGGTSRGKVGTIFELSESDTTTRYVNQNGISFISASYLNSFLSDKYCLASSADCGGLSEKDIFDNIVKPLNFAKFDIISPTDTQTKSEQFIKLASEDQVNTLRNTSFAPSMSADNSAMISCEALEKGIMAAAGGGSSGTAAVAAAQIASSPTPSSDKKPQKGSDKKPQKAAKDSKPEDCGFKNHITVKDENSTSWKHDGKKWVPLSIELARIDKAFVESNWRIDLRVTTGSEEAIDIVTSIPTIAMDSTEIVERDTLISRIDALEKRPTGVENIYGTWYAVNTWKDTYIWSFPTEYTAASLKVLADNVNSKSKHNVYQKYYAPTVDLSVSGGTVKATKIPLPDGYNAYNSFCAISGFNGLISTHNNPAFVTSRGSDIYLAGEHGEKGAILVRVECYGRKT